MPAPIAAAAALAARFAARKLANDAAKKSAKKALKTSKKSNPSANPKSAVKVLPRKTAPKTDLSNRGNRPTRSQRSERAADLSFKKAEARYEGEYLTRMTGLKGPKGVTSQRTRGQGTRSLRKEAAIKKEANKSTPIKINSARPFTSPKSGNIFRGTDILKSNNARALKAANKPTRSSKSKLTMREKAGKAVVNATIGKTAARKYAASKLRKSK